MNLTYARWEMTRLLRNRQNLIFSLAFPLVLFFAIAAPNASENIAPPGAPVLTFGRFYLAGMIAFGSISAVVAGGARIALERQIGWTRQLRLTPLRPGAYLRTKIATSYVVAIIGIVLLTLAAVLVGARLDAADWFAAVGLVLVALVPFAAIGVFLGHLVKGDSMGPIVGGSMSLFSIVGGAFFPITSGFLYEIGRYVPSYWLVQAGKTGIGGQAWTPMAWLVVGVWSLVFGGLAAWAYRRDTARQ